MKGKNLQGLTSIKEGKKGDEKIEAEVETLREQIFHIDTQFMSTL